MHATNACQPLETGTCSLSLHISLCTLMQQLILRCMVHNAVSKFGNGYGMPYGAGMAGICAYRYMQRVCRPYRVRLHVAV